MQCKSLWIKASAKCINVNVNVQQNQSTGRFSSQTLCLRKKLCHSENIIIFVLNNTYSLSTGPTVLISYITVMFYKTTSFKTLFFLLLKIKSYTVKSVFSPVHHQCKLHGENFYITLVNIVHSNNTILS